MLFTSVDSLRSKSVQPSDSVGFTTLLTYWFSRRSPPPPPRHIPASPLPRHPPPPPKFYYSPFQGESSIAVLYVCTSVVTYVGFVLSLFQERVTSGKILISGLRTFIFSIKFHFHTCSPSFYIRSSYLGQYMPEISLIMKLIISCIAPDKWEYAHNNFFKLNKNISCGYSLEAPLRGASNEYPQHMLFIEK